MLAAALILDSEGRALLVRKQGTIAFMQPGGKIEPGENAREALVRELSEELTLTVDPAQLEHLGRFAAAAANEPGWSVDCEIFTLRADAGVTGSYISDADITIAAEIAEARWFDPAETGDATIAPLTLEHVFPVLVAAR